MVIATVYVDYMPTEKQAAFHRCGADEALYGGAAGGGKSRAVVMEALVRCMEYPGTAAYLFRRTYRELEDTLIAEALACIPPMLGRYVSTSHEMRLINGSVMRFRHCMTDADRFDYQGAEIHHLFIDELTHFSKEVYDYLKTRLRARAGAGFRPIVRCTANPGGVGHAWVKRYFIDPMPQGGQTERVVRSEVLGQEQRRTVAFIPARATDNPYLSQDYIFELEQKPKALRQALLLGDWNAFEGQVFAEWRDDPGHYADRRYTHVVAPFPIPAFWPRARSFDFGYTRPFSVGWWATDPEGRVYRYREWYGGEGNVGLKLSAGDIARGIREAEEAEQQEAGQRLYFAGVADPAIFDGSRGESIAAQMQKEGVYFEPGSNARLAGKLQLHERLRMDEEGRPGLQVFRTCRDFIRTLPALVYDPHAVEDVNTAGEDHIYDETRYFLQTCPVGAPEPAIRPHAFDPLAEPPRRPHWMAL